MDTNSGFLSDSRVRSGELQEILDQVKHPFETPPVATNHEELEEQEQEVRQLSNRLSGLLVSRIVQGSLDSKELSEDVHTLVNNWPKRLRNEGKESVRIRTLQGQEIWVRASYYRQRVKRGKKKRHPGVYPGLLLLGVHEHCTPALSSEVSLMTTASASMEEAQLILKEHGIELNIKTIRSITYNFAQRARLIHQAGEIPLGNVDGRRVVVSSDGGRIRIRKNKRGPKTKKKRNRYKTDWREPKLLIIYVVDAEGQKEQSFSPLIDGTLKGPDALFALLGFYLTRLEITRADRILFVADGAPWIWNRLAKAVTEWGLKPGQVLELVDFYHAVEHLGKVAALCKKWTSKKRKQWITRNRRLLLKGKVSKVVEAVKAICRGRNSKKIRTHRNYFVKNADRMAYAKIKEMKMPIGSGAMESAIRRVVNLRLKGASIYWHEDHAEAMILLRSFFKAGRWSLLKKMANQTCLS